jgi:hypothetical protein
LNLWDELLEWDPFGKSGFIDNLTGYGVRKFSFLIEGLIMEITMLNFSIKEFDNF